jgi:hypothetical protein
LFFEFVPASLGLGLRTASEAIGRLGGFIDAE